MISGGRVEVRLVAEAGGHHRLRQEGDDDGVGVRGERADRDEGVHVRLAVAGAPRRGDEEASPEDELDDRGGDQEPAVDVGHRPRRAAGPEHDRHHHAADDQRRDRLEEQLATLGGALELGGIDVGGCVRGGIAAHVVAGGLDGGDDSGSVDDRGIEAHRGPLRREVDGRVTDAIGAREIALDPVDAARAGHADDRNAELCGRNRGGWRAHRCSQDTTGEYPSLRAPGRRATACSLGVPPLPWRMGGPGRGIRIRECPMPPFPHRERHPGTGIAIQRRTSVVGGLGDRATHGTEEVDGRWQVVEQRSS